jgi:hypothetical protein
MNIYKTDERFMQFCRLMYDENCRERWSHGQEPYPDATFYIEKNLNFLMDKYRDRAQTGKVWKSIYLS